MVEVVSSLKIIMAVNWDPRGKHAISRLRNYYKLGNEGFNFCKRKDSIQKVVGGKTLWHSLNCLWTILVVGSCPLLEIIFGELQFGECHLLEITVIQITARDFDSCFGVSLGTMVSIRSLYFCSTVSIGSLFLLSGNWVTVSCSTVSIELLFFVPQCQLGHCSSSVAIGSWYLLLYGN